MEFESRLTRVRRLFSRDIHHADIMHQGDTNET
jgi:hypothetical protein